MWFYKRDTPLPSLVWRMWSHELAAAHMGPTMCTGNGEPSENYAWDLVFERNSRVVIHIWWCLVTPQQRSIDHFHWMRRWMCTSAIVSPGHWFLFTHTTTSSTGIDLFHHSIHIWAYARSRYRVSWTHVNRCVNKVIFSCDWNRWHVFWFDWAQRKNGWTRFQLFECESRIVIGRFSMLALINCRNTINSWAIDLRSVHSLGNLRGMEWKYGHVSHLRAGTL